jgi:hypothetical protein
MDHLHIVRYDIYDSGGWCLNGLDNKCPRAGHMIRAWPMRIYTPLHLHRARSRCMEQTMKDTAVLQLHKIAPGAASWTAADC